MADQFLGPTKMVKVPPELFTEWLSEALLQNDAKPGTIAAMVADRAAQWAADQELEACEEWLRSQHHSDTWPNRLRAARRPKPPSLAEQGCDALDAYIYGNPDHGDKQNTYNTIRAALDRLAELENHQ
jgi:hypothetical protein